jgi:hypothetical protein
MSAYPAVRYNMIGGEIVSRTVNGSNEEVDGWLPSPHRFRATSAAEFIHQGHAPDKAEELHQRELRRVKLIAKGISVDEAEELADHMEELSVEQLISAGSDMKKRLEDALAENGLMRSSFEKSYAKLKAENEALRAKLARKEKPEDGQ